MKKIFLGLVIMSSMSAFADEHCSFTWKKDGRTYADVGNGADVEVFVPAHASKSALKFFKSYNSTTVCLIGSKVPAGDRYIFIATNVKSGI